MLNEAHDLVSEFPEHKETIHKLKMTDTHFLKLFDEYNQINKDILRIETGVEHSSDEYAENLKKRRLSLKDDLYGALVKAK